MLTQSAYQANLRLAKPSSYNGGRCDLIGNSGGVMDIYSEWMSHELRVGMSGRSSSESTPVHIEQVTSFYGNTIVYVDGLCVETVESVDKLLLVKDELKNVMASRDLLSGTLLIAPSAVLDLSEEELSDLADDGISVERASTNNLSDDARAILTAFWVDDQEMMAASHESK